MLAQTRRLWLMVVGPSRNTAAAKAQAEALKGGIAEYAEVAALTLASAAVAPTTRTARGHQSVLMPRLDFRGDVTHHWSEMAQHAPPRHRYTYAEYLAYEQDSRLKHEYEDGQIVAMAGGSRRHNALASRVSASLEAARKPGCVAFQSDQKVRVLATGKATYPDATLVCGTIEGDPADPSGATITNPTLIVEVLSPSTEQEDRGNKWQHYQLIPSLREYVLVSQHEARVELYRRLPGGTWEYSDVTRGTVQLSTGAVLDLTSLYEGLPE